MPAAAVFGLPSLPSQYNDKMQPSLSMPASEAVASVLPSASPGGRQLPAVPCDCRPVEELLALYKGLVEVSTLINAITDFNELLTEIMDVARRVMRAEGSTLFPARRTERRIAPRHRAFGDGRGHFAAHQAVPRKGSVAGWVFERGESALDPGRLRRPAVLPGSGPQDRVPDPRDSLRAALPPRPTHRRAPGPQSSRREPIQLRRGGPGCAGILRQPRRHGHREDPFPG